MLAEGDVFGKYKVERVLGKGGMGVVYLVRHVLLETEFALKVLSPEVAKERPEYLKRFLREAKLASRIRHPNLVAVYDAGHDDATDLYYLVMDYVSGGSLRDRLAWSLKPMPTADALRVVREMASALATAEPYKMVHRDVKPENIMFDAAGNARLADFGLAKAADSRDSLVTSPEDVFGTPSYMAPEQIEDSSGVDARADVYSLGVVLFEMLAGRRPYADETVLNVISKVLSPEPLPSVQEFAPDVPPALSALIGDMCAKNRDERIQSASEVLARLDEITPEELSAGNQKSGKRTKRKASGSGRWIWIAVAAILVLGACAAMKFVKRNAAEPPKTSAPSVAAASAEDAERIKREERLAEERRQIEAKRQAEEKRIADERRQLDAERKRMAAAQAKLDAENKRLAKEKAEREEAEAKAKREAAEKAKREAEAASEAKRIADAKAAKEKAEREAVEKAQREKEAAEREAKEKAKREAEAAAEAKRIADAKAAKEKAEREAAEKAQREKESAEREAKEKAEREAKEKAEREATEKAKRDAEEKAKREAAKTWEFRWDVTVTCHSDGEVAAVKSALAAEGKPFEVASAPSERLVSDDGLFSKKEVRISWKMRIATRDGRTPEARQIVADFLSEKCRGAANWNDVGRVYAEQDFATAIKREDR